MQTSYFKNFKNLPKGKAVAICQGIPVWYKGPRYMPLAPSWALIAVKDPKEYQRQYFALLEKLDPAKVFKELEALVGGDAILLCWEADSYGCHRRLVADWLSKNLDIPILEYPKLQPNLI